MTTRRVRQAPVDCRVVVLRISCARAQSLRRRRNVRRLVVQARWIRIVRAAAIATRRRAWWICRTVRRATRPRTVRAGIAITGSAVRMMGRIRCVVVLRVTARRRLRRRVCAGRVRKTTRQSLAVRRVVIGGSTSRTTR